MYRPHSFQLKDRKGEVELIQQYPFATIISQTAQGPFVSHLPLLFEEVSATQSRLIGHLARANPHSEIFTKIPDVLVVFNGPSTYITPSWYKRELNVPTWNYCVVHVHGKVKISTHPEMLRILKKSVEHFEMREPKPWPYQLPPEFHAQMEKEILGFEIEITEMVGKFKLSQNRTEENFQGVVEGLSLRADEGSKKILALMLQHHVIESTPE